MTFQHGHEKTVAMNYTHILLSLFIKYLKNIYFFPIVLNPTNIQKKDDPELPQNCRLISMKNIIKSF